MAKPTKIEPTPQPHNPQWDTWLSPIGYILAVSYPVLALSTGVRALYQFIVRDDIINYLPVTLSAVAALCYLIATIGFAYRRRWTWWLSFAVLGFETTMTLIVGTWSFLDPQFIGGTVWRHFGEDYGYFPLFQPLLGLAWLLWPQTLRAYGVTFGKQSEERAARDEAIAGQSALKVVAGVIALAMALPLFYLVTRASSVGASKAAELLLRPQTLEIIANSLMLATLVTLISLVVSLPLAWLTVNTDLPGQRWWSVLGTLPLVFPSYVGSYSLVAMMGPRGIVQGWLEPLGVERLPSIYGLFGATWALTIFTYPYLFLSIRAGLRNLDPAILEAARSLGYNPWHTFLHVTLPNLRPSIASGALLVSLYVLSDFGAVSLLRFNSFTRAIYVQYSTSFDRSLASLLALALVIISLALLIAAQRMQGRARYHRAGIGAGRRLPPTVLGRWRWPALVFCAAVVMASLVLPAAVVAYWLVRGLQAGESLMPLWAALGNTIRAATLAALVASVLALPVAYLVVRFPTRYSWLAFNASFIGNGLPGIVIALSLVFFGANYVPMLYQTIGMLIFAYVVRFLPEATGTLRAGLLQISPRLEEAARTLGFDRGQAVRRVTIPLLQPSIWAGVALVFLSTVKELPATLLLGPTGFSTLATQIWSATSEAFYARAAAPALILLLISALSIVLILRQEDRSVP